MVCRFVGQLVETINVPAGWAVAEYCKAGANNPFEILLAEDTKVDGPVPMLKPHHKRSPLQAEQDITSRLSLIRPI
jgi:hypothetical protein